VSDEALTVLQQVAIEARARGNAEAERNALDAIIVRERELKDRKKQEEE